MYINRPQKQVKNSKLKPLSAQCESTAEPHQRALTDFHSQCPWQQEP